MTRKTACLTSVVGVLLILASVIPAFGIMLSGGALGPTYTYKNPSYFWWNGFNLGPDLPSFRCHVESLNGSAEANWGGTWYEIWVCTNVDGATAVQVSTRTTIVLRDPIEGPMDSATSEEPGCDCDMVEIPPGTQFWVNGPEDPSLPWPLPEPGTPVAVASPDTTIKDYYEYVVEYVEDTEATRIINSPYGATPIIARAITGADTAPVPLNPGESIIYSATGEILGDAWVMVRAEEDDTIIMPTGITVLEFQVWNLSPTTETYDIVASDSYGWGAVPSAYQVTLPPGGMEIITVTIPVPPEPGVTENMVDLSAESIADPTQRHWDAAHVIIVQATPATSSWTVLALVIVVVLVGAWLLRRRILSHSSSKA